MKGLKSVIITFLVVSGLGLYVLLNYGSIARKAMEEIAVEEGGREGIEAALAKGDEAAFVAKYQPLLKRRWLFALGASFLDEESFLEISKDAVNLYNETPLDHDEIYAKFLYERGMMLSRRGAAEERQEAYNLLGLYLQNFPDSKKFRQADNARTQLTVKYGVH
jgi:hypothetical protein